jgi:hypothetical protein
MDAHLGGRFAAALAALATAGLIDGCDAFGPSDRVTVRLPDAPPHWQQAFPRLSFELEYPGPDGAMTVTGPYDWGTRVVVTCSKRANGAFLAWPLCGDDPRRLLRPAGGLYPLGVESGAGGGELGLTWADGCLAVIVLRLAVAGRDTSLLDAAKLGGCLAGEPDPWRWDLARIEQGLADGVFSARDLVLLPTVDAVVQPGEGAWFLETPFGAPLPAAPGGTLEVPGLPHGLHTLYGMDGRRVRLYADGRGVFTVPMDRALPRPPATSAVRGITPRASSAPSAARRTRGRSKREAA